MSTSTSDRPPFIIVHLIRHASSNYKEGGEDFGLCLKGERQCDELYENMRKHAGYITHIFSSPMKRCLETARKGLREAISRGVLIQPMPALAGRNGRVPWSLREGGEENLSNGSWVVEPTDTRSKSNDADFVMGWLTGKNLSLQEAQKVLEVVVVSQRQLLSDLLWKIKGNKNSWDNATIFTYSLNKSGKWTLHNDQKTIDSRRVIQQEWKRKIEVAAAAKKKSEEKEAAKKLAAEEKMRREAEKMLKAETNQLNELRKDLLLTRQVETERIMKEAEEMPARFKKAKLDKLKRDLLSSQDNMRVVDRETNEIVTFAESQVLLKKRYAQELPATTKPVENPPAARKQSMKRSADNTIETEPAAKKTKTISSKPATRKTKTTTVKPVVKKEASVSANPEAGKTNVTTKGSAPKPSSKKSIRKTAVSKGSLKPSSAPKQKLLPAKLKNTTTAKKGAAISVSKKEKEELNVASRHQVHALEELSLPKFPFWEHEGRTVCLDIGKRNAYIKTRQAVLNLQ